jgi:L-ascorbate metabolism protein UlaG (beta-lactamase superfamily)
MKKTLLFLFILGSLIIIRCKDDAEEVLCTAAPVVSAGNDTTLVNVTTLKLFATSSVDEGTWTIEEGEGGSIDLNKTPAEFTGVLDESYELKWESTNTCGTSSDTKRISVVDAGADMTVDELVANIHWIEQSSFRIEGSKFTIYTDPLNIVNEDQADIILITHPHGDHFSPADIAKIATSKTILIAPAECSYTGTIGQRIVLIPGGQHTAFGCINIKAVPAYNIVKTQFHPKSNNWVGYVVTMNGVTFYQAGDTERVPEMKDITTDIAMLSLGQTYTFENVAEAAESARDVKAKVAIPMHFGLYEGTQEDATTFKSLLEDDMEVVIKSREQ